MSFFAGVPEAEPPRVLDYRPPPWSGPPDNVVPVTVAVDAVLVRRDDIAVWIAEALVYPDGAVLGAGLLHRRPPQPERAHAPFLMLPGPPGAPRFGVGFADAAQGGARRGARRIRDRPRDRRCPEPHGQQPLAAALGGALLAVAAAAAGAPDARVRLARRR